MKTLSPWSLLLCLALATSPAWAQRRPPPPGGPPTPPAGERQITPQPTGVVADGEGAPKAEGRTTPTCEEARRRARYGIYFDKVDIEKLVQTVSDATCKTFILPENVRGKISIIGPENGRVEVDAESVLRRLPRRARLQRPVRLPARPVPEDRRQALGQAEPHPDDRGRRRRRTPPTSRW